MYRWKSFPSSNFFIQTHILTDGMVSIFSRLPSWRHRSKSICMEKQAFLVGKQMERALPWVFLFGKFGISFFSKVHVFLFSRLYGNLIGKSAFTICFLTLFPCFLMKYAVVSNQWEMKWDHSYGHIRTWGRGGDLIARKILHNARKRECCSNALKSQ